MKKIDLNKVDIHGSINNVMKEIEDYIGTSFILEFTCGSLKKQHFQIDTKDDKENIKEQLIIYVNSQLNADTRLDISTLWKDIDNAFKNKKDAFKWLVKFSKYLDNMTLSHLFSTEKLANKIKELNVNTHIPFEVTTTEELEKFAILNNIEIEVCFTVLYKSLGEDGKGLVSPRLKDLIETIGKK